MLETHIITNVDIVAYAPVRKPDIDIISVMNVNEHDPVYVMFFADAVNDKFAVSVSKKLFDFSTDVQYFDTINPAIHALTRLYNEYNFKYTFI